MTPPAAAAQLDAACRCVRVNESSQADLVALRRSVGDRPSGTSSALQCGTFHYNVIVCLAVYLISLNVWNVLLPVTWA